LQAWHTGRAGRPFIWFGERTEAVGKAVVQFGEMVDDLIGKKEEVKKTYKEIKRPLIQGRRYLAKRNLMRGQKRVMEPLLKVTNLNKSFKTPDKNLHILKDINFDIADGEMTAVMGPSGAGKSTLLHILGALDRPSSGDVLYRGRDIFRLGNDALADFRNRKIGFVFQFHHLLTEFNALENAIMPALISGAEYSDAKRDAERLLSEVGLSERISHRPGELSGGEQQRVAVARALMLEPEIVLADEPTGNLDTETGENLFRLLLELNKGGKTFIVVTHNENLASMCRKIIRMKDGRIV